MRNKRHYTALIGIMLIAVLAFFTGCSATSSNTATAATNSTSSITPAGSTGTVELKLAHAWATTHPMHKVITVWADEVNKSTNGRVHITIYPGGTLAKAAQIYGSVATGAVDMACMQDNDTPGNFPVSSAIELPFIGNSAANSTAMFYELMAKYPNIAQEHTGVKILFVWGVDAGQLMTTNKTVRNIEDIKGLTLHVISGSFSPLIEALGAIPVLMDPGNIPNSLQKGITQGAVIRASLVKFLNLAPDIKNMVIANAFTNTQAVVVNNDSWNRVSSQDQNIIMGISGQRMAEVAANAYDSEVQLALQMAKDADVDIYTLPEDELNKWKAAVNPICEKWANDLESRGIPGKAILEDVKKLSEKYK